MHNATKIPCPYWLKLHVTNVVIHRYHTHFLMIHLIVTYCYIDHTRIPGLVKISLSPRNHIRMLHWPCCPNQQCCWNQYCKLGCRKEIWTCLNHTMIRTLPWCSTKRFRCWIHWADNSFSILDRKRPSHWNLNIRHHRNFILMCADHESFH